MELIETGDCHSHNFGLNRLKSQEKSLYATVACRVANTFKFDQSKPAGDFGDFVMFI